MAAEEQQNARVKDVTVLSYIGSWDPKGGRPVDNFLMAVNDAAELGNLEDKDTIKILKLKVLGTAQTFLDTHPEMREDGITFARVKEYYKKGSGQR